MSEPEADLDGEHGRLMALVPRLPQDYEPWGTNIRWADGHKAYPDCSCGCKWARWLEDLPTASIGLDWCVCTNPASYRVGLLTFEHQGCQAFEQDPEPETEEPE